MTFISDFAAALQGAVTDLIPIAAILIMFKLFLMKRNIRHISRMIYGLLYVALGMAFFRIGLSQSLIPIGEDMAEQLVSAAIASTAHPLWGYLPVLAFATLIGFAATLIEHTLIAAAARVQTLSGGALQARAFRLIIAGGVALGLMLGTMRIIFEIPLPFLLFGVVSALVLLIVTAPREIVSIALDSGGIATSVVTVPLIAAYGVAIAEALPNNATAVDGFGLVVLALLLPVALLLLVAKIQVQFSAVYRLWRK